MNRVENKIKLIELNNLISFLNYNMEYQNVFIILFSYYNIQNTIKKKDYVKTSISSVSNISRLQGHNRDDRKVWCQCHIRWSAQDLGTVLFRPTDEYLFNINHNEKNPYVYMRQNQLYNQQMIAS